MALSGHKAYAPFGTGALIGRRDAFLPRPHQPGGGTVRAVTADDVLWADLPDREEPGSPNVVGAVALAAAVTRLAEAGLDRIAAHDRRLAAHARDRLGRIPGVRLYGPAGAGAGPRVGVVPFTLDGLDPGVVAAVLGYEHGIGARSGCFCAQPYVAHLLDLRPAEMLSAATTGGVPGMVRLSFGAYTTTADIDRAVDAVAHLAARRGPDRRSRHVPAGARRHVGPAVRRLRRRPARQRSRLTRLLTLSVSWPILPLALPPALSTLPSRWRSSSPVRSPTASLVRPFISSNLPSLMAPSWGLGAPRLPASALS